MPSSSPPPDVNDLVFGPPVVLIPIPRPTKVTSFEIGSSFSAAVAATDPEEVASAEEDDDNMEEEDIAAIPEAPIEEAAVIPEAIGAAEEDIVVIPEAAIEEFVVILEVVGAAEENEDMDTVIQLATRISEYHKRIREEVTAMAAMVNNVYQQLENAEENHSRLIDVTVIVAKKGKPASPNSSSKSDEVSFMYRDNSNSRGYYDGRYWTMWKLPMFGCTDSSQVMAELEEAKEYPQSLHQNHWIRQVLAELEEAKCLQCVSFIAYKPAGY
ncbi:hypothetical protein GIB67_012632 [Kingdonia uniflora]|uniref:Ribulose bisphosphate carboxylase small subunit domain-containing protein n=1 Tax=Kingdonia uniflora TaxID=39325 RepID=A0A7J7NEX3_9MAGN|nr:hypothetical protein GIB67_012632 [Kingdonia uniflora]